MIRKAAVVIMLVIVASLCVAGCTVTNTSNPSPTETQNATPLYRITTTTTNATSKAITDNYASNGYEIVKPFVKATNQYGNVVYMGVVNDANATHLTPYQHNVTIELMKNKTETKQRVSQLAAIYIQQGFAFPANMTGIFGGSDSTNGAHEIFMGGCDPTTVCLSGLSINPFSQFTVVVDVMTRQG
jgi:hypothetical protein